MAVFKCKMCGGALEVNEGMSVCECEYCGTTQTLPKTDNEQTLNMLNRANHFRQQYEFDKAMEIYERILNTVDSDAEIYWSIVLCRYGIEYVDDPLTKKKIPTCHRTQYKSILEDADYLSALSHADSVQKELYQKEAKYIDDVQKGILEISNKEEPFDVFICYKESDNGKRTHDSVLAQELYYQLVQEGFKVFFSRITLEGKLGTAYEPYIFAALNSSKVMVVVGTKPEYFNSVWVKNEWSRYLMLMQNNKSKILIPAYKDMDPYDLPDELSMFQAQDMSKLGFMQDLIRGINKIINVPEKETVKEVVKETVVVNQTNANIDPLLKRAFMFLEDGDWAKADSFCEQVLNQDPECAQAYLGKLLAEMNVNCEEELINCENPFDNSNNYKKLYKFSSKEYKKKLDTYRKERVYRLAEKFCKINDCEKASELYKTISDYKDSAEKANKCIYDNAMLLYSRLSFVEAQSMFEKISDYKDSKEYIQKCIDNEEKTMQAILKNNKKGNFIYLIFFIGIIIIFFIFIMLFLKYQG